MKELPDLHNLHTSSHPNQNPATGFGITICLGGIPAAYAQSVTSDGAEVTFYTKEWEGERYPPDQVQRILNEDTL